MGFIIGVLTITGLYLLAVNVDKLDKKVYEHYTTSKSED